MPSTIRSEPCNGWGRRVDSNLRTRTSSAASTKRIFRSIPRSPSSARAPLSSSKNWRPRTSITTAILVTVRSAKSQRLSNSAGGKLSTTYQPRSSIAWATVDRPAPLIPVTRTTSADMALSCPTCLRRQGSLPLPYLPIHSLVGDWRE